MLLNNRTRASGLHQDTVSLLRKVLPVCLILAILLAKVTLNSPLRYFADITIAATGQTSSTKPGSTVVWLSSPSIPELKRLNLDIQKSDGWEIKDAIFISNRNQPAALRFSGFLSKPISLQLIQTPYAGVVEIRINGYRTRVDLVSPDHKVLTIDTTKHLSKSMRSSVSMGMEFAHKFLANFLALLLLSFVVYPLYRKIPALEVKKSSVAPSAGADFPVDRSKPILLIALLVSAALVIAFYPGVMVYDSYEQYWQAIHFSFVDWHPPVMALLWSVTDRLIKGTGGMLLLQLLGVVFSFYLLSRVADRKGKKAYWLPLFAVLLPMVSCCIFFLIKDVSMAVSLLLTFSLWYFYRATGKLTWPRILLIFLILFYAAAVRKNALPAVLPLIFVVVFDLLASWKKAFAVSVLLAFVIYLGNELLVYHVLRADRRHPFQVIMMHDLMGIYALTQRNYVPENYLNKSRLNEAMRQYDHRISARTTVWHEDWFISYDDAIVDRLKNAWVKAIRENVTTYLTHRWILFKSFLTDLDGKVNHLYAVSDWNDAMRNLPPPLLQETPLGKIHSAYVNWTYSYLGFLFKAYFWLMISSALFLYALKRKVMSVAALASSSLFYFAPYFFVAPSVNYRYIYWPVIASITSLIVIWMEKDAPEFAQSAVTKNKY